MALAASDLCVSKNIQVKRLQSSTKVKKNRFPSYVGLPYGPQMSQCRISNNEWETLLREVNDNLLNLARGQI